MAANVWWAICASAPLAFAVGSWLTRRRYERRAAEIGQVRLRIDIRGRIVAAFGAVEDVLGYRREQLVGNDVTMLMPAHVAAEHGGYVRRFAASLAAGGGSSRVLGRRRLVAAVRGDGSEQPFVLQARPLLRPWGLRFEGTLQLVPCGGAGPEAIPREEQAPRLDWRWLRNLGHEVRTPMAAIQGHAEILVDARSTEEERRASARAVLAGCHHLIELLNDLLDHARLAAGGRAFEPQAHDVRALLDDVVALERGGVERKGLRLEVVVDADVPAMAQLDALSVRQVLLNLIGNAVKFTPQGFVRVDLRVVGDDRLQFDVSDSGVGMRAEFAPRLFEPFQQEERAQGAVKGSGLGLSICRQLARRMGGELTLVDSVPGAGSRFRLELPVAPAAAAPPRVDRADALRGVRCLVVDDAPDVLRVTTASLDRAGAQVIACGSAEQALQELEGASRPFDVALLDLMMPGMDGFALATALRGRGFAAPLIALSGASDDETAEACERAGFDRRLTKPVRRDELVAQVHGALHQN